MARKIKIPEAAPVLSWEAFPKELDSKIQETSIIPWEYEGDNSDGALLRPTKAQESEILKELNLSSEKQRLAAIAAILPILGTYKNTRLVELNAPLGQDEVRGASKAAIAIRSALDALVNLGPNATAAINSHYDGHFLSAFDDKLTRIEKTLIQFVEDAALRRGAPGYPALQKSVEALAVVYEQFTGAAPRLGGPFTRFCQKAIHLMDGDLERLDAVAGMVKKVLRLKKLAAKTIE